MLRFFLGPAGAGKTRRVMDELRTLAENGEGGSVVIVPEQYSHEAERELCACLGGSASLYAEVLSFTALSRRALAQRVSEKPLLDNGGRLLCMALALDAVSSRLRVYGSARRRPELQSMLLNAVTELKTARQTPDDLLAAAARAPSALGDKLRDLALIGEAYAAVAANGHTDPADRLDLLAEDIERRGCPAARIYIDGFLDFTAQELRVVSALLKTEITLTVCLNCLDDGGEGYAVSAAAARALEKLAKEAGAEIEYESFDPLETRAPELSFFAEKVFSGTREIYPDSARGISLYRAEDAAAECEFAAAKCLELVRETGCRLRDIAVAVRGFEDYRLQIESQFELYGVPLFTARKAELLSKPLPSLISGAYELITANFDLGDMCAYIRTGLAGLDFEQADELENYLLLWEISGSAWLREGDWTQHPEGYGAATDDAAKVRLNNINALRRVVAQPLIKFKNAAREAETASAQARALADFFNDVRLAENLAERADYLRASGAEQSAQEYAQLWELIVSALEQAEAVLGRMPMDAESFGRLFILMLSQYDIGAIPVSLDRVCAGDFDRMRRRDIKHLILLGASDERLPAAPASGGVFSPEERRELLELDVDLGSAGEDELWREFALIYNTLSLPSQSLTIVHSVRRDGQELRESFIVSRAAALFGCELCAVNTRALRINALAPAVQLAAGGIRGAGAYELAAAKYLGENDPERLNKLAAAADLTRGRLSESSVRRLYGQRLRLSASRIEKFASCRFAYFMQYGLRAKKRESAAFRPPELGSFMHYVLQHTAEDVMSAGGFKAVSDEALAGFTDGHIAEFVRTQLNDFHEKTQRFRYLFSRLSRDVRAVVFDMAAELRAGDFMPIAFEFDLASAGIEPLPLGEGEDSLALTGIADRVDGYLRGGKLYLRVVDYKTGRKKFDLSEVRYGRGLQMLLYLFTLQKNGRALFGRETVPAGVLYIPARDALLQETRRLTPEEAEAHRVSEKRRSGLLLDDAEILAAMENSDDPRFIPVKFKNGEPTGEALAKAEHMGLLSRRIDETLRSMARELRRGSIAADPYYRSAQENACLNCDYFDACHFGDGGAEDGVRYMPRLSADEFWQLLREENDG